MLNACRLGLVLIPASIAIGLIIFYIVKSDQNIDEEWKTESNVRRDTRAGSIEMGEDDTVVRLNREFEKYFATTDSLTEEQWKNALPTPMERIQMSLDERQYCVIHEKLDPKSGKFPRYWGYVVIRASSNATRPYLHHSAAHFQTDGDVCAQAAALFERTGSRTLVVAGASRFAVQGNLTSPCQPPNALADAAHNNETMFHLMNVAISEAMSAHPPSYRNVFIQWHGMANTSCPASDIYASAGARSTNFIYQDPEAPVNKIVRAVNRVSGSDLAKTPAMDSNCRLQATTNVFGRFLNGVTADQNITGDFVHIEQKQEARDDWEMWTQALEQAFAIIPL
ncbi:hypothetical protein DdX_06961 [Ditylenchus destructor]|uniref:Uncharacterized protein n=1 Tax=Ditylenchus destructor TaxID=166010 RepID=A0AAD4R269_9BILA|nr:hypothetical protein DdX_06961 [Ditylenchus destructor]